MAGSQVLGPTVSVPPLTFVGPLYDSPAEPLKTTLPGPVSVTPLAVPLPLTRLPEKVRALLPVAAEAMLSELLRVIVPL